MAANNLALRKANDIRSLISQTSVRKQLAIAAPKHLSVDRLLRVAMTAIQKTPRLLDCTPDSILACVMTCAELGLEPSGVLGQAYFVPYRNKRGIYQAQFIPGYRGYIALARRTGDVLSVQAQAVFEEDHFVIQYGTDEKLEHIPTNGERGKLLGAYVFFKFKDGGHSFDWMTVEDIEKIRKRSKASDDGPWKTDYNEMAKKTVIRRHAKLTPMSIEYAKAAALEDRALAGESQFDLLDSFEDAGAIDAEAEDTTPADHGPEEKAGPREEGTGPEGEEVTGDESVEIKYQNLVDKQIKKIKDWTATDFALLGEFVKEIGEINKMSPSDVMAAAVDRFGDFWAAFEKKKRKKTPPPDDKNGSNKGDQGKKRSKSPGKKKTSETPDSGPGMVRPCPDQDGNGVPTSTCLGCDGREGCPSWDETE